MKKNNQFNDEIDLSEMIRTIWSNKFKIFIIIVITVAASLYYFQTKKISEPLFLGKTKIVPISIFNDVHYGAFNSLFSSVEEKDIGIYNIDLNKRDLEKTLVITKAFKNYNLFSNSSFKKIDRRYLYELFIEKLSQNDLYEKGIKKFNLLKRENYQNNSDYENAIIKLASSLKKPSAESEHLEFKTSDNNKIIWEKLLIFIQNSANKEIQNYLRKNFELLISNENRLKKFKIEDIDYEIGNNLSNSIAVTELNKLKDRIIKNRDIERLINVFHNTPIMKSDNFVAAKLKTGSTEYITLKKSEKITNLKILFLSIIFGFLLGSIYVLITNVIIRQK